MCQIHKMSKMNRCIYCKQDLSGDNSSREHVWPAALGWDTAIPCVCRNCNGTFGHEIDAAFIGCFDAYRVKFKVANRDGEMPRPRGKIEGGALSGKQVRFGVDGPELPPIIKTADLPGSKDYRTYQNHDVTDLEKKLAARGGIGKLVKLSEGHEEFKLVSRNGMEFLADLSGMRGAVKIAFNYLALKMAGRESFLLGAQFDGVRDFIRGTSSVSKDLIALPMSPMPPEIPLHSVLVTLDGNSGQVRGRITLFGFIGLYIRIADGYTGESAVFGTLIDPESREHKDSTMKGSVPEWIPQMDKIHKELCKEPQALDAHKWAVFNESIQQVNSYFQSIGDSFQIALPDDMRNDAQNRPK